MKNVLLMNDIEPTDDELIWLMHEVAVEAKEKALVAQQLLAEEVKRLIGVANEKR